MINALKRGMKNKMTTYMTWLEMYQSAYDPLHMDLGSGGRNAALALRQFDLQGEEHLLTRKISHSPLERAFFAMGDEVSRVNTKLWNFNGGYRRPQKQLPVTALATGVMSFTATAALLYVLQ